MGFNTGFKGLSFPSAPRYLQNPVPMDAYKPILLKQKSVRGWYLVTRCQISKVRPHSPDCWVKAEWRKCTAPLHLTNYCR